MNIIPEKNKYRERFFRRIKKTKPLSPAFTYTYIYSDLSPGTAGFDKTLSEYKETLNKLGGTEFNSESKNSSNLQLFFMTTGGTEKSLLKTIQSKGGVRQAGMVYIVAHPEFNSLPASLEALARLQVDGLQGEIIFFKSPSDKKSEARILQLIEGQQRQ